MSKDLSDKHGYRKTWPFVPVFSQDLGGWIDSNAFNGRGNEWIRKVADSPNPTEDEIRIIREAFAVDASNLEILVSFDPNSLSDSAVIVPLRKLGMINDDEIERIIEEAEISIGVSGTAGKTTLETLLTKIKDSNGVAKSPGLRVLDGLYERGVLPPRLRGAIFHKKSEFILDTVADLSEGMGIQ